VQRGVFDAGRVFASICAQTPIGDQARLTYEETVHNSFEEPETFLVGYAKEQEQRH
jgi:hypothetical protein